MTDRTNKFIKNHGLGWFPLIYMKLIFVSGGVISGLGKGITASSLGRLLKSRGLNVSAMKIDPYLNIDAGSMDPFEHGETYILSDGGAADLDLGNYERFLDLELDSSHNMTTGKVYRTVIDNERNGRYLGKTVQIIPHITNEIKRRITTVARESGADVMIIELGGTVGDIEAMPFLEAARQLGRDFGRDENVLFIHTTLIPIMGAVGEEKTKPTQHSVKELMSLGIRPDIIVGRCPDMITDVARAKIAMFCDVDEKAVISSPDARSIYEIPLILEKQGVADHIIEKMKLSPLTTKRDMGKWEGFLHNILEPETEVRIALIGKFTALADSYRSHLEAFTHAGAERCCRVCIDLIDSDEFTHAEPAEILKGIHGIIVPGGFGVGGIEGKIAATEYARVNGVPFLGTCLGFQIATIEICRHVLGLRDANSVEFDGCTENPVISRIGGQHCAEVDGVRSGTRTVRLGEGSKAAGIYGSATTSERYRHSYEINPGYASRLEAAGWRFTGISDDDCFDIGELEGHPFFMAAQFHPEFRSRPLKPSALHLGLVDAAIAYAGRTP